MDGRFLRFIMLSIYQECGTRSDPAARRPRAGSVERYTAGVYVVTTLCRAWWTLSHKSETDPDYVSLFVNLYSQYRVLDITCSERDSFLVHHSRCLLPLSLAHVIRLDEGLPKLLSIASISPFSHYQDL